MTGLLLLGYSLSISLVGRAIVVKKREEPSKAPLFILGAIVFTLLGLTIYAIVSYHGEEGVGVNHSSTNIVLPTTPNKCDTSKSYVVIYGSNMCGACRVLKNFFNKTGIKYLFREVYSSEYSSDFGKLVDTVAEAIDVSRDVLAYTPFSVVVNSKGEITAIVVGAIEDEKFWRTLMCLEDTGEILVYYETVPKRITNKSYIEAIEAIVFKKQETLEHSSSNSGSSSGSSAALIPTMVMLASVDSINPCAISTTILLALTASTLGFIGRRQFVPVTMFILGVYIGYVLAGYVLTAILSLSKIFMLLILGIALALIARDIKDLVSGREFSIECRERECLPGFLQKLPLWILPVAIMAFGVVVSWTFMMCSAAPYIVFLTILANTLSDPLARLFYILVYCILIIIPLAIAGYTPVLFIKKIGFSLKKLVIARVVVLSIIVGLVVYYIVLLA